MQVFPVGSVARLFFDLVTDGVGRTSETPTIAIQRGQDGLWLDSNRGVFQPAFATNPMLELDRANLPGRYYFDFDHQKDALVSARFIAKMASSATPLALSYQDLYFGKIPAVVAPGLCAIQGTLFGAGGVPLGGALVQATLIPVFTDTLGRGYEGDAVLKTFSGADGNFELGVVQGATIRLEIRAIGYDRRAVVPTDPSVLFIRL